MASADTVRSSASEPGRMQALVVRRPRPVRDGPLELVDIAVPSPGPGEILLSVRACAVCRTDLQIAIGDLPPHKSSLIPGHQAVGIVTAIGAGVTGWAIGERAGTTWLAGFDGTCRFCLGGQENLCQAAVFTGWDHDGGFAQFLTVRADVAARIPDELEDIAAAPLLCGGVIGYRALRLSGIQPGGRLGLYGFGASARQAIQVARAWGCEVHVASRSGRDLEAALALGASSVGGYGDPPPELLDAAVTFTPAGAVVIDALRAVQRGGIVVINAIHLDGIPAFSFDDLWWERSIRSVANVTRRDAAEFMTLAAQKGFTSEIEIHPLSAGNEALRRLDAGEVAGAAVLIPD